MKPLLPRSGYNRIMVYSFSFFVLLAGVQYMAWEGQTSNVTVLNLDVAPGGIVYIADPHVRAGNYDHTWKIVDEINRLHPSVVLIGGDFEFVNGEEDLALQDVWSGIDAPVYAVLGNHDYHVGIKGSGYEGRAGWLLESVMRSNGYNARVFCTADPDMEHAGLLIDVLERNGVHVLRNEVVELNLNGRNTTIVGVDDVWAGLDNPPVVPETDSYVIYLVHEPEYKKEWNADLVLAGHTHGGQFNIGGIQLINTMGLVDIYGMTQKGDVPLFVTRGIGTSNFEQEYRFMASPEIVLINP